MKNIYKILAPLFCLSMGVAGAASGSGDNSDREGAAMSQTNRFPRSTYMQCCIMGVPLEATSKFTGIIELSDSEALNGKLWESHTFSFELKPDYFVGSQGDIYMTEVQKQKLLKDRESLMVFGKIKENGRDNVYLIHMLNERGLLTGTAFKLQVVLNLKKLSGDLETQIFLNDIKLLKDYHQGNIIVGLYAEGISNFFVDLQDHKYKSGDQSIVFDGRSCKIKYAGTTEKEFDSIELNNKNGTATITMDFNLIIQGRAPTTA